MFDSDMKIGKKQEINLSDQQLIEESSVLYLKETLIPAILVVEDSISVNLGSVVELIARDKYEENWKNLLPDISKGLETNSPEATYRLFRTAQPIFKKIRFMYRSDSLYSQINYALSSFGPAFTKATEETNGYLKGADLTPEQESMLLKTILEAFGIYLSLNSVDEWPDYFEDTFSVWGGVINDMLVRNES